MGADTVTAAVRQAVADRRVRAILFRVDSPGGSYVASDAIWRELGRARQAGKPVVVSMGNVAGSGGYFVALPADRVVAHPATLTGSIGVVGGKAVVAGLAARLGLTSDEVHAGDNALMWSPWRPYTPEQWARLGRWLDRVYADFTAKVAQGRGLTPERVEQVARGRVWTGADALGLGLVDGLGGYPVALRHAREVAGLAADAPVRLRAFPRPRSWWSRLTGGGRDPEEDPAAGVASLDALLAAAGEGPLAEAAALARSLRPPGPDDLLTMPDPPVRW